MAREDGPGNDPEADGRGAAGESSGTDPRSSPGADTRSSTEAEPGPTPGTERGSELLEADVAGPGAEPSDGRVEGKPSDGAPADRRSAERARETAESATVAPDGLAYDVENYRRLLGRFLAAGYEFVGFHGSLDPGEVALRHDVDLSVERAVEMARVEAQLGVESTYCFLVTAPVYDLLVPEHRRRIERIVEAGHDVGLHFDTHRYWEERPDPGELAARVAAERQSLARIADAAVDAVSFHVPPEWVLGTRFEGFTSTYEPGYFEAVGYASDSNQKWRRERPFPDDLPESLQLLVHPGLWHEHHRPMSAIVAERRRRCERRLAEYVAPLGG